MNYEESLARLEQEKKRLKEKGTSSVDAKKAALVERVIKGYSQSLTEEISNDKVEETFKNLAGFAKEKEELKRILSTQRYYRAHKIKNPPKRGKILCFVGPPGVGKTYFAEQYAKTLGKKYFRISLGGSGSAIILTGGKEIWLGAAEGKIISAIVQTESCDPVILIDEVEKKE